MSNFFKNFPITAYEFKSNNSKQIIVDIFRHIKTDIKIDDAAAYSYYDIQDGERPDQISNTLYETPQYYWTFFLLNDHLRDGLHNWPKEYNELQTFLVEKYPNKVITSYLESGANGTNHFLHSKFIVGETITGDVTGHTATIKEIKTLLNQLVIENATGDFTGDTTITGSQSTHTLTRDSSYDFVVEDQMNAVHNYEDASGQEISRTLFQKGEVGFTEVTNREYEENRNDTYSKIRVLKRSLVQDFARAYKDLINR
jgi:hypothetical protein